METKKILFTLFGFLLAHQSFAACPQSRCDGFWGDEYTECKMNCIYVCGGLGNITTPETYIEYYRYNYCVKQKFYAAVRLGFNVRVSSSWTARYGNYFLDHPGQEAIGGDSLTYAAGSWSAGTNNNAQWIQVSSELPRKWVAIETQGRADADQWVTEYTVIASNDGINWIPTDGGRVFTGNSDRNTKVKYSFNTPVTARTIRLIPNKWYGHISLRFEVYFLDA